MKSEEIISSLLADAPKRAEELKNQERADRIMLLASTVSPWLPYTIMGAKSGADIELSAADAIEEVATAYMIALTYYAAHNPRPGVSLLDTVVEFSRRVSDGIHAGAQMHGLDPKALDAAVLQSNREIVARADRGGAQ